MAFSPTDACFEGFRLVRREPASLALWAAVYFVTIVLAFVGVLMTVGLGALEGLRVGATFVLPTQTARILSDILPATMIVAPCLVALVTVQMCAVYRAVLRPEDRAFAYLRLGADELRVLVVLLTLMVLFGAGIGLPSAALAVAANMLWPSSHAGAVLLAFAGFLFLFCAFGWVGVRLSLAPVDTFAHRAIRIWESWDLTRMHVWPLIGMYALVVLLGVVVSVAGGVVQGAFEIIAMGAAAGAALSHQDLASAAPLMILGGLGSFVVMVVVNVLLLAVTHAPQARAWRELTGGETASVV